MSSPSGLAAADELLRLPRVNGGRVARWSCRMTPPDIARKVALIGRGSVCSWTSMVSAVAAETDSVEAVARHRTSPDAA
jgi:hypothetical protein